VHGRCSVVKKHRDNIKIISVEINRIQRLGASESVSGCVYFVVAEKTVTTDARLKSKQTAACLSVCVSTDRLQTRAPKWV